MLILLIIFLVISIPLRIIISYSHNYTVAKYSRIASHVLMICLISIGCIPVIFHGLKSNAHLSYNIGAIVGGIFLIVPIYHFGESLFGIKRLYDAKHIKYMDSFILYLRSFKDDKKKILDEFRILCLFQNYFKVFEVGRPNEFYPSNNCAQHLYIGENWKENVLTMMDKAVFILMRINTTDNYLWEFEQCHSKKLLDKVIFWITDLQEYKRFCAITYKKYKLELPPIEKDNSVMYYMHGRFKQYCIKNKKESILFANDLYEDKTLYSSHRTYFYGKKNKLRAFLNFKKCAININVVKSWNTIAFLFPALYTIFSNIKHKNKIYFGILFLDFSVFVFLFMVGVMLAQTFIEKKVDFDIPNYPFLLVFYCLCLIIRVVLAYLFGKNGDLLVWLSENWESVFLYEKKIKSIKFKTISFVLLILIIEGLVFLI